MIASAQAVAWFSGNPPRTTELARTKGTDGSVATAGDQLRQLAFEHDTLALFAQTRNRRADLLAPARGAALCRGTLSRRVIGWPRRLTVTCSPPFDFDQQLRQAGLGVVDGDLFHD